jgi:hypothetical protein
MLSFALIFIQACNQDVAQGISDAGAQVDKPESIMGYYNFLTAESDGVLRISSYTTQASQDFNRAGDVKGFFYDKNRKPINGGSFKIGGITLNNDPKNNFVHSFDTYENHDRNEGQNLFGTTIKVDIAEPILPAQRGSSVEPIQADIYLPALIKITRPEMKNTKDVPYTPISVGTEIGWNVDEKNEKGIVILLDYNPEDPQNINLETKTGLRKTKAITVKDNESFYRFKQEDVMYFPKNAYLNLTIGRANFLQVKGSSPNSYSFYAYTVVNAGIQVKY